MSTGEDRMTRALRQVLSVAAILAFVLGFIGYTALKMAGVL